MTSRKCKFPGCPRKHDAKGYCHGHWSQQRKGRALTPLRGWSHRPPDTPKPKPVPRVVVPARPVERFVVKEIWDGIDMSSAPRWSGREGSYT